MIEYVRFLPKAAKNSITTESWHASQPEALHQREEAMAGLNKYQFCGF